MRPTVAPYPAPPLRANVSAAASGTPDTAPVLSRVEEPVFSALRLKAALRDIGRPEAVTAPDCCRTHRAKGSKAGSEGIKARLLGRLALLLPLLLVANCGGHSDSDTASDRDSDNGSDINLSGTFVFTSDACTVLENESAASITVTRTGGSPGDLAIDYASAGGTDRETSMGTLEFADGETAKSVNTTAIDTPDVHDTRGFDVALSNPIGRTKLG